MNKSLLNNLRAMARNCADGVPGMAAEEHIAWQGADEIEQLQEELVRAEVEIERLRDAKSAEYVKAADALAEIKRLQADKESISGTAAIYLHEVEALRGQVAALEYLVKTMIEAARGEGRG